METLFKTDIAAMRLCFTISIILCFSYNIFIFLLSGQQSTLLAWWVRVDSWAPAVLSSFIPAFHKVENEMKDNGYVFRVLLFQDVMSVNFLIVISSLFAEMICSLVTYITSNNYIYKKISKNLIAANEKKTGKSFSIKIFRILILFMFVMVNMLMYTGLGFIVPRPLYDQDYKIIFVCLLYIGVLGANFAFVLGFLVMPFWIRLPKEV